MVKVVFPALWFPGFKLWRGQLLNVTLFGVGLVIPPWDITFWEAVQLTSEFVLFDTDVIAKGIGDLLAAIPKMVWDFAKGAADSWADAFYKAHSTYEEYVKEREQEKQEE